MAFASTVRVAALFSGGKDSTYAAYAAVQRGWELTHLLSILPEDRESMLFHVPNLHMTALLAEAMQRPLISEEADKGEEGELDALRRIFRRVDVDGIVVGTIASDYQHERVNRVAEAAGLRVSAPPPRRAPRPEIGIDHRRRACGTVRRSLKNWDCSSASAILAPATFASFRQAVRSRDFPAIANARASASYA